MVEAYGWKGNRKAAQVTNTWKIIYLTNIQHLFGCLCTCQCPLDVWALIPNERNPNVPDHL